MRMIADKQCLRELAMLQYQAERYRLAGNGFMTQHLYSRIRKIQEQLADSDKNWEDIALMKHAGYKWL